MQEVQAERDAVRAGFDSRAKVVSRRGNDVEEVDAEIAEDNRRADEAGMVFDSDPRKTSNAGMTQAAAPGNRLPDTTGGAPDKPDADIQDEDDESEERDDA